VTTVRAGRSACRDRLRDPCALPSVYVVSILFRFLGACDALCEPSFSDRQWSTLFGVFLTGKAGCNNFFSLRRVSHSETTRVTICRSGRQCKRWSARRRHVVLITDDYAFGHSLERDASAVINAMAER